MICHSVSIDTSTRQSKRFEGSKAMRSTLGDSFVTLYTLVKQKESIEFQEIVTPWEREVLMFNV